MVLWAFALCKLIKTTNYIPLSAIVCQIRYRELSLSLACTRVALSRGLCMQTYCIALGGHCKDLCTVNLHCKRWNKVSLRKNYLHLTWTTQNLKRLADSLDVDGTETLPDTGSQMPSGREFHMFSRPLHRPPLTDDEKAREKRSVYAWSIPT